MADLQISRTQLFISLFQAIMICGRAFPVELLRTDSVFCILTHLNSLDSKDMNAVFQIWRGGAAL